MAAVTSEPQRRGTLAWLFDGLVLGAVGCPLGVGAFAFHQWGAVSQQLWLSLAFALPAAVRVRGVARSSRRDGRPFRAKTALGIGVLGVFASAAPMFAACTRL